jgi:anti-sigma B factor antagonist
MRTRKFEASLRWEREHLILDLNGEMDSAAEEELNTNYAAAEKVNPSAIILNFSNVNYINSIGIALIVGLLARSRKDHRRLIVFGLSRHYTELFNITRLSDFMDILPDETSALADFPGPSSVGQLSSEER